MVNGLYVVNEGFDLGLLPFKLFNLAVKFFDLLEVVVLFVLSDPFDLVLGQLFDIADTLQYISNIVDSSLLNVELLDSIVEVKRQFGAVFDQADKLAGEYSKPWQQVGIYTLATGVSLTRVLGQEHFPTDVLLGSV